MQFDKQTVLDHISQQVGPDQASQAAQMLPDQVDHEQHAGMLRQLGVDPQGMANQLGQQSGGGRNADQGRGYDEQSGGYRDRNEDEDRGY